MMGLKSKIANWSRFQTIVKVLAKHGFSGIIHELGISVPGIKLKKVEDESIPKRLRLAFEELGPTFVKLGQVLSTRPDIFPENYIQEFSKLTDRVPAFEFEKITKILEAEYGRDPSTIFDHIQEEPIGSASMAQVHLAKLKDSDQEVVIKVQRPGIRKTVQNDIQVLLFVAQSLEKLREDFHIINLTGLVKEFQKTINEELDFTREARNIEQFHDNFANLEGIKIPEVHWDFTTKKILTMSRLHGTALSQVMTFPENVDRQFLCEKVVEFFFESIFFHGLFHADAHPGNFLLNAEGDTKGELGLVDFGMVGTLAPQLRQKLSKLFLSIISQDYEALAIVYGDIGIFRKRFVLNEFTADVKEFIAPHLEKPLKDIHVGQVLMDSTKVARNHKIQLPRDLIMFFRAVMTLEHVGHQLDPDFELMAYGKKFGKALIKRRFSFQEVSRDLVKTVEGFRTLGTELPTQLKLLVRRLEQEDFGTAGTLKLVEELRRSNRRTMSGFLCMAFFITAALLTSFDPDHYFVWPLWIAGFLVSGYLMALIVKP
jgi:ubiquinone biosynthesis protein